MADEGAQSRDRGDGASMPEEDRQCERMRPRQARFHSATLNAASPARKAVRPGVNGAPRRNIQTRGAPTTRPPTVIEATQGQSL